MFPPQQWTSHLLRSLRPKGGRSWVKTRNRKTGYNACKQAAATGAAAAAASAAAATALVVGRPKSRKVQLAEKYHEAVFAANAVYDTVKMAAPVPQPEERLTQLRRWAVQNACNVLNMNP